MLYEPEVIEAVRLQSQGDWMFMLLSLDISFNKIEEENEFICFEKCKTKLEKLHVDGNPIVM